MVHKNTLWKISKESRVPLELRDIEIRLYEKVISMFNNSEGQPKYICFNIGFKCFPFTSTLFGIYIHKLEACLEKVGF